MTVSLALAIAVAAGVAGGVFLDPSIVPAARWVAAGLIALAFVMAARDRFYIAKALSLLMLMTGSVIWGSHAEHHAMHPPLRQVIEERLDEPMVIEGRLTSDAYAGDNGATLRVTIQRVWLDGCPEPTSGGVSLTVVGALAADSIREWRAGRIVRAPAALRRPARYLDYGVPDQERLLARRGVAFVGTVKSAALVQVVGQGSWLDETAAAVRSRVRQAIQQHVGARDPQSAAIAIAILIGDRGSLDPVVEQRLQEAGTYHVIAISGGNIAILAALILATLWLVGIRDGWAAAAAAAALASYAFMAGGGASVVRATLMAAIYLLLRVIDQRTSPLHALSLTALVILLASPLSIADVGLWLTFGATAAIIAGVSLVPLPASWWLRGPLALLLASLSAELLLMPIGAMIFQRVTIAGLGANLVAVPCMAIAQVAAMTTTFADVIRFGHMADLAGALTDFSVRGLLGSARLVDWAPWLTWRVPSPLLGLVVLYYAAVVICCLAGKSDLRRVSAAIAGALFVWMAIAPATLARRFGDGQLHLTMLDIGQGDAMLVTFPNGRTLLVDTGGIPTGGGFDVGDRVLGPALRHRGLGRLDYLAITHGDLDHVGGAASVARDFAPGEIWYGTFVNNHAPTERLRMIGDRRRTAWRSLLAGDRIEIGGVELRVHHPPLPDWQRQKVRNDDSLVIELRYGQVSFLLTGDISAEVERALLPTLDLLPTVVLKSPHHGSGTSSSDEFLRAIRPALVLISAGRGNPFGHPVPHVLARYRAIGADVLRTDRAGQIDVVTDGRSLRATTFTGIEKQLPALSKPLWTPLRPSTTPALAGVTRFNPCGDKPLGLSNECRWRRLRGFDRT